MSNGTTIIEQHIARLGNSQPIFKLSLDKYEEDIHALLVDRYIPTPTTDSPVEALVCEQYLETLHRQSRTYVVEKGTILTRVKSEIASKLISFYSYTCQLKNPKASKTYKFLVDYRRLDTDVMEGLVMLYEYVQLYGDKPEHKNNALAILDAMRGKYYHE